MALEKKSESAVVVLSLPFSSSARDTILSENSYKVLSDMEIKEIRDKLRQLAMQKGIMETKLADAIADAIRETANENPNPPQRISNHICTVRLSDMVGNPWNYEFYDWLASAEFIIGFLKKYPVDEWKNVLRSELKKSVGNMVPFKRNVTRNGYNVTTSTPLSRLFVNKIIEKI